MPECDFGENSWKRPSFQIDAPAGMEDISVDGVRTVVSGSVVTRYVANMIVPVIVSYQSKLKDVFLIFAGIFENKRQAL